MITEQLRFEVEKFLKEKFSFVKFEVYSFFNDNRIFWTHDKVTFFQDQKCSDKEAFLLIDTIKSINWSIYDEKVDLKYIIDEFKLFSSIFTNQKYKVADIKVVVKSFFKTESLVQIIKFNPLILDLINEGRHRVTSIYPEDYKGRQKVNADIGDKVYFCDNINNIVNPAYVIGNFANEKLHIAYFTNWNSDNIETQKLTVNGWGIVGAYKNEVGLTPNQAIKNRMQ